MVAALQSDNWRAYYSLGNSLREIKSFEKAAEAYEAALELNPGHYYASYNLGYSLQLMGKLEEAINRYELTLEMRETRAIYVNMAICYTNLGDEETAEEYYRLAEELRQGR